MEIVENGGLGLWVLQTLDRRSCTQSELNERRPCRHGNLTLFPVLCQLRCQGLISREAGLPRYRTLYTLTGAGRQRLRDLEKNHLSHHLWLLLDQVFTDLYSLALRECSRMNFLSGAVLIPSRSPDLLVIEGACDLLATLVPDEKQRYLVTPELVPTPKGCRLLLSPLRAIDLPPTSLDLVIIPVPTPTITTLQVQEINRLLSISGVLLIALPFSAGARNTLPGDDPVWQMIAEAPWLSTEEEMALIRTLDLYFDVYCLRHNRSALLICRRWGTDPEEGADAGDQVYPCRVVEVND